MYCTAPSCQHSNVDKVIDPAKVANKGSFHYILIFIDHVYGYLFGPRAKYHYVWVKKKIIKQMTTHHKWE